MSPLPAVQLGAFIALLGVAAILDLRHRRIPNTVTVPGLVAGLVLGALMEGGWPWPALAGAGLGFAISFPLFAFSVVGAGDAKLFTAVGAFTGPAGLLATAVYAGLAGGVLALAGAVRGRTVLPMLVATKDLMVYTVTLGRGGSRPPENLSGSAGIPYGVAIAVGGLAAWFFPLLPGVTP